jgi:addiction module HigA family antidote
VATPVITLPSELVPEHPGELLLKEFLSPRGLTQRQLADAIRVPYQRVNEIVNGRRGITPSTALRLSRYFGVSASFWLTLQLRWELYRAQMAEERALEQIAPHAPLDEGTSTP